MAASAKLDQSLTSIIASNKPAKKPQQQQQQQSKSKPQQSNAANGSATKRQQSQKSDRQQKQQSARQANGQNRQPSQQQQHHQQQQQPQRLPKQSHPLQQLQQPLVPSSYAQFQAMYPGQHLPGVYNHPQHHQQQSAPQHQKPAATAAAAPATIGGAQKIVGDEVFISGLATDLIGDDLREIFHSVGGVKSATINYNEKGVSQGTATVVFTSNKLAEKCVAEFDAASVEGKIMRLKLIGKVVTAPVVVKKEKATVVKAQQPQMQQPQQFAPAPAFVNPLSNPFNPFATAPAGQFMPFGPIGGLTKAQRKLMNQMQQQGAINVQQQQPRNKGAQASSGSSRRDRPERSNIKQQTKSASKSKSQNGKPAGKDDKSGKTKANKPKRVAPKPIDAAQLDSEMDTYHSKTAPANPAQAVGSAGQPR